jgi:NAD-dependent SIR2 family protein deacetylase
VLGDDKDLTYYRTDLTRGNLTVQTVLRSCNYLKDELDEDKQFPTWFHSVFGSLHEVYHPEVSQARRGFHRRVAGLLTKNYDELLQHHCELQRIRRSIPDDVRKYEQGTLNGVFHMHGSFQDPKEVVRDSICYYQVTASDDVQDLLKTYLDTSKRIECEEGVRRTVADFGIRFFRSTSWRNHLHPRCAL